MSEDLVDKVAAWLKGANDGWWESTCLMLAAEFLAPTGPGGAALAEARAEGRRQGLEEAAKAIDVLATIARSDWAGAQTSAAANEYAERERALGGATNAIRSLATAPNETQSGFTRISFDLSLSPEGWLRVSGVEPRGLILSSADHDALLADIGPAIKELLQHVGKWHPDSNNGVSK